MMQKGTQGRREPTWNTANTVTGSVAEMIEPKHRESMNVNGKTADATDAMNIINPITTVDRSVPRKAYMQMDQKLEKKGRLSME